MEKFVDILDWYVYFSPNAIIEANLRFSVDYADGDYSTENYLSCTFNNQKEIKREWIMEYESKENGAVERMVMEQLNEGIDKELEKMIKIAPMLLEKRKIVCEEGKTPDYNPHAKEFWFELEEVPAKFMLLHSNDGDHINFRMKLKDYHGMFFLELNHPLLEHYKNHSKKRLYFLY